MFNFNKDPRDDESEEAFWHAVAGMASLLIFTLVILYVQLKD